MVDGKHVRKPLPKAVRWVIATADWCIKHLVDRESYNAWIEIRRTGLAVLDSLNHTEEIEGKKTVIVDHDGTTFYVSTLHKVR